LQFNGEPPSFCAYCGNPLGTPATAVETAAQPEGPAGDPAAVPDQVGGYRILRPLGAGAMGVVYEAENPTSGQHVALKLISPEFATSPALLERFRQEGRLASGIAHPRCVFVLAADEEAGRPYIVMELMPGDTLETLVERQGPLPPEEAVAQVLDVIDGLREVHRLGIVHRDVKPSNCFLDRDGRVKVGDFGLAKSLVTPAHLTQMGAFLGTLLFSSPEQVRTQPVDQQSDVYAVAATLYYLLAGRAPFQGGDFAATAASIAADPVPPLRGRRPDVPADLDRVVLRGLERDRARRWRSLEEFRAALLPFAPGGVAPARVDLRFCAYLLDALVLLPLGLADSIVYYRLANVAHASVVYLRSVEALYLLLLLLYYGLPEGLLGWTPGKRWLRLRVWRAAGCQPPGLVRGLLRAGIWLTLLTLPNEIGLFLFDPYQVGQEIVGIQLLVFCLGLVLVLSTMRARNGFRCLHDVLSGTRVVCLPDLGRLRPLPGRRLEEHLLPAERMPECLARFVIRGAVRRTEDGQVLLGEDPSLGRQVLLWVRPRSEPPLGTARRELGRPGRLRWLAAGEDCDSRWDAFSAPTGCPLSDLVTVRGPLSWAETRPLLEQFAGELAAGSADGTLPHSLAVDQVWVQLSGQPLLLDFSLDVSAPGRGLRADEGPTPERMLRLLGELAALALEGHPRPAPGLRDPVRAPVPGHAARILRQLLQGPPDPYRSLQQLQADLAAAGKQPAEVSGPHRAAHLALLAAFLFPGMMFLTAGGVGTFMRTQEELPELRRVADASDELEKVREVAVCEFAVGALTPGPASRLRACAVYDFDLRLREGVGRLREADDSVYEAQLQTLNPLLWMVNRQLLVPKWEAENLPILQAQRQERLRTGGPLSIRPYAWFGLLQMRKPVQAWDPDLGPFATVLVLIWPVLWVLWAFLWPGGLSFRLIGLSLVRADGRPAARWQCAWRALLVWAPVTALLVASIWLEQRYWVTWAPANPSSWLLRLGWLTGWSAWALLLVYVGLALWHPSRGLHDRLAGTYLVPR
jgi:hypothetical protein